MAQRVENRPQNMATGKARGAIESSLIKMGKNIGAKTLNGLVMFIYQGLASLDLWFGKDIENQVNFKQIKSYLERHLC